ncbi:MAG TPA: hypothetical protein VK256_13185 [Candidatus Eisenbacteria bacterium]|nr:hypothetical protein [Candidatus Eisenbacteria bacterium]
MAGQEFQTLVETGLLRQVETVVVEAHRDLYLSEAKEWSRPLAYRWLHYEDPMPVERLLEGTKRLRRRGAEFNRDAVEKACQEASKRGFLN